MIDANSIILGFTGSIGSGCTYISRMLSERTNGNYKYFKLSDLIRQELERKGISSPTVEQMQEEGNSLRKAHGKNCLPSLLIRNLSTEDTTEKSNIIIDGIKNDGEVALLRQFPYFYLFSINADREIRQGRVVRPDGPFKSDNEFLDADKRDENEDNSNGQQVKKCNSLSDIIIVNEKEIPERSVREKENMVDDIKRKYVELIQNNVDGNISPEIFPSVNELCMTIAYSLSKKSSCLKRKVGAVIIDSKSSLNTISDEKKAQRVPHIIASGYNEVPEGSHKCVFDIGYQKCYRDHLQEMHAQKMKFCPSCGCKIKINYECPNCNTKYNKYWKICRDCKKEIKVPFICDSCTKDVFEEHLPGSKNTPGKLLDLCRALHAEEMAILQLSKRGSAGAGDLILYATTQPCNLCANKIATSGIKKVVYAEPYNMKEAAQILIDAGVELERFEGIKSSAYFKLYN